MYFHQLWKIRDYFLVRHSCGKPLENIADSDSGAGYARFPKTNPLINGDIVCEFIVTHA